jgi:PTH1 family peptidyl-tRNA hydrolase
MRVIVGLGNPGRDYANTRHNIGFLCLDELARRRAAAFDKYQLQALTATLALGPEKVLLAKPQTYMNASGDAVGALLSWYKVTPDALIVVTDDLDLPFGRLRLRLKGSAGGHNGLKSIIERLGTPDFPRLRVGIGRPPGHRQARGYVLNHFTPEEEKELPFLCPEVADALELAVAAGFEVAMNRYNVAPVKAGEQGA